MKMNRSSWLLGLLAMLIGFLAPALATADKASVAIEAPAITKLGEEVIIKVKVTHCCNSAVHYVNWVDLQANGKEVKKWKYSSRRRPPSADFEVSYKYKVEGDTALKAEANCIIHGSAGPGTAAIKLAEEPVPQKPSGPAKPMAPQKPKSAPKSNYPY